MKGIVSRLYRSILFSGNDLDSSLNRSAIFFAPHPDDEVLGCGGTIARKVVAGADVHVVIMTDGSRSHTKWINERELASIRAREAAAAALRLGVREKNLTLLAYQDKKLSLRHEVALDDVRDLLRLEPVDELYIPCQYETPADHHATNTIVRSAARDVSSRAAIYEYPIWFWSQWPFGSAGVSGLRKTPRFLLDTVRDNLRLLTQFRHRLFIGDVLADKVSALGEYNSQMTRYRGDDWPILADVADGAWLDCFMQQWEIFRKVPL
jgi:LmbE family N-acetylglucosaminyl deacetylase